MKTTYNIKEASDIMGVTPEFTRRLILQKQIPNAVVVDGYRKKYLIPKKPFLAWLGITEKEVEK